MNGILSSHNEQQKSQLTDIGNEFVYTIIDQQGKIVLGINAHGDVVVNELIAQQIRNAEFSAITTAIAKMTKLLSMVANVSNANHSVVLYLTSIIETIIRSGNYNNFSIVTNYGDSRIVSLDLLELCPHTSTANFCLYTTDGNMPYQYVAYYDYCHQLTVALRHKSQDGWSNFTIVKLDSYVGDDNHNYIHMIVDKNGYLHLCANMHADPLNYWRFTHPYSLDNYVKEPMTNSNEDKVTYPFFIWLKDDDGEDNRIMFAYRNGVSGNGNHYVNFLENGKWNTNRLIFKGSISSETNYSAYCCAMIGDFNGSIYYPATRYFELFYLWRETPNANTCCRLCYVKTQDFEQFKTYNNNSVTLPIQYDTPGVVIDDVPSGGGLINTYWRVLQTNNNGTLFCYHKYGTSNDQEKSKVWAVLINENHIVGPREIAECDLKLNINDKESGFSLNMKEETNAFVVRCGVTNGSHGTIKTYYLNKNNLSVINETDAGQDFYEYPTCIRTTLDNTANNARSCVQEDIKRKNYLIKYEVPLSGKQILPTYLKVIEYTN